MADQVALDVWSNLKVGEVAAAEYLVWLPPEQIRRPDGVSYDDVPTRRLPPKAGRPRGWRIENVRVSEGRSRARVERVVHVYACPLVSAGNDNVLETSTVLQLLRSSDVRACGCARSAARRSTSPSGCDARPGRAEQRPASPRTRTHLFSGYRG
ncbi:hypothetical protein ABT160_44355 [Streptomyces sp. NPDC001941]|uniref:hypothetical protein n=1 Tax=Streptomyces sp. NPDC001941 TaxID=3154659 RepID=UPI00331A86C7